MSGPWSATKARLVLSALERIGWTIVRQNGSHRTPHRDGWPAVTFPFHDGDEVGPVMLSKIAKATGLTPEDL